MASYSSSVTMAIAGVLVGLGVGLEDGWGSVGEVDGTGVVGEVDGLLVKVPGRGQGGSEHPSLMSDPASSIFVNAD